MRRTLTVLAATASLALCGAAVAGPVAAAPSGTGLENASAKSVHLFCNLPADVHPGKHAGWSTSASGERRNLGGNCGPVDPT